MKNIKKLGEAANTLAKSTTSDKKIMLKVVRLMLQSVADRTPVEVGNIPGDSEHFWAIVKAAGGLRVSGKRGRCGYRQKLYFSCSDKWQPHISKN